MTSEKQRSSFIGGSDMASVLNIGWGCRRRLWLEKRDVEPDHPFQGTGATERGTFGESAAVAWYAKESGRKVRRYGFQVGSEFYFGANLDRHIVATEDGRGPGVLEAKCPGSFQFRKYKREGLPEDYSAQLQWYMCVTGWKWGAFVLFDLENWQGLTFEMERDENLITLLRDEAQDFWRTVENGPEPERLSSSDRRCQRCSYRTTCQGAAMLAACEDDHGQLVQVEGLEPLVDSYVEAKHILDEAEQYAENCAEQVRAALGNTVAAEVPGYRVYFRPQISMRWDTKALDKQHPELAKDLKKPSVSRPLRLYPV